jgi:hypothetical protein
VGDRRQARRRDDQREPFGRVSKADRLALAEEGERLARFIAPESKAQRVTIG